MSRSEIRGIVPPVLTPLTAHGEVDVASLERLVERLVEAGCHGLFALGSSGEVAYLDARQRATVVETVVRVADSRVPVLVGAIEMTATRVREQLEQTEAAGVAGVVVTAPFYAINDAAEVEAHFRAISAATRLEVWAYDIPVRVRTKLDAATLVRLGRDGVIAGVKDSSGDDVGFRRLVTLNRSAGSPLSVLTGHETVVDGMLLLGADGVVPGLANVDPEGYVQLWNAAQAADWTGAAKVQDRLATLFEIVFQAPGRSGDAAGVGAFKAALHALGVIDSSTMAHPVQALTGDVVDRIAAIVRATGLERSAADPVKSARP